MKTHRLVYHSTLGSRVIKKSLIRDKVKECMTEAEEVQVLLEPFTR